MDLADKTEQTDQIELSEPGIELVNVRFMTIRSTSLHGRGDASVFIPPGIEALTAIPVILMLHGVYGSHWAWFFKGAAHETALALMNSKQIRPMILVTPSDGLRGDGSGYLNHSGFNFETWISEDVVNAVMTTFPFVGINSPIFIGGLSMGGYGALRIGAKFPDKFRGISAHSAITDIDEMKQFLTTSFPFDDVPRSDSDITQWCRLNKDRLPPIRFDCGISDPLIEGNRRFHRQLEKYSINHSYHEFSGGHSWEYWRTHFVETLLFFEQLLLRDR